MKKRTMPSNEEINNMDKKGLEEAKSDLEFSIERMYIEIDTYDGYDSDKLIRTKDALTYHKLALKRVNNRLYENKKERNIEYEAQKEKAQNAKKEKLLIEKEIKKENKDLRLKELERAKARDEIKLKNRIVNIVERTSYFRSFIAVARQDLDEELFTSIENKAFDRMNNHISNLNKIVEENKG